MKYTTLLLVSLLIACNSSTTQNSNTATDTTVAVNDSEMRSATATTTQQSISSLCYTQAQAEAQYKNTPNVKQPLDTFWYNIQPNFATNGQLHNIGESMEYFMIAINNNQPFKRYYSWEYATNNGLRGQYLYVTDRNKSIVPSLQYSLDTLFASECKEFGFVIDQDQKNIQGYYQKFSIKKVPK